MQVLALVGPSGTGKSHRAIKLAHELGCQIIIDDGLIIEQNKIIGGVSAKKQPTRLGAIKTAVFTDPSHQESAISIINSVKPSSILILGTSNEMVAKITKRLHLPNIERIVSIYDVASQKEIRKARYLRTKLARHVIPAPAVEVRKSLGNSIVDTIRIFFDKKDTERHAWSEQSVVRPTFTSLGGVSISESAIQSAIRHQLMNLTGVVTPGNIKMEHTENGLVLTIGFIGRYGDALHHVAVNVQSSLYTLLDGLTIPVSAVNVIAESIIKSEQ